MMFKGMLTAGQVTVRPFYLIISYSITKDWQ